MKPLLRENRKHFFKFGAVLCLVKKRHVREFLSSFKLQLISNYLLTSAQLQAETLRLATQIAPAAVGAMNAAQVGVMMAADTLLVPACVVDRVRVVPYIANRVGSWFLLAL